VPLKLGEEFSCERRSPKEANDRRESHEFRKRLTRSDKKIVWYLLIFLILEGLLEGEEESLR
jgi:hypothetical protein